MEATARIVHEPHDDRREARRAAELVGSAAGVLREHVMEDGAMARALDRLERVARSLELELPETSYVEAVRATHDALAEALRIGRAMHDALEPRGQQCIESLAAAQRTLYPVAREHGVVAPPPLPPRRADEDAATQGIERRASPRVDLAVDVSFESENNFYQGFSEDLSDGGLFIATYQLQPIGHRMELEFTLPNGHIIRATGVVRWVRQLRDESADVPPGMGLQFEALRDEDAAAIGEFVRARNPIFFDDDL